MGHGSPLRLRGQHKTCKPVMRCSALPSHQNPKPSPTQKYELHPTVAWRVYSLVGRAPGRRSAANYCRQTRRLPWPCCRHPSVQSYQSAAAPLCQRPEICPRGRLCAPSACWLQSLSGRLPSAAASWCELLAPMPPSHGALLVVEGCWPAHSAVLISKTQNCHRRGNSMTCQQSGAYCRRWKHSTDNSEAG
jgi:hypothetical protein